MSISAEISPHSDLASQGGVSGCQSKICSCCFSAEGLISHTASPTCSQQFLSQMGQTAHTRSCQPFPQQLLAPPNPLECSWRTHIYPAAKADLATYSRGNPSSAGISSAETGFSEHVLGLVHEVVRYFTSPVAPMTTGTPRRGGISLLSFASGDAGKLLRSWNLGVDQPRLSQAKHGSTLLSAIIDLTEIPTWFNEECPLPTWLHLFHLSAHFM